MMMMAFSKTKFKQVVGNSGLTKVEIAVVYKVSRQTIYGWLNSRAPNVLVSDVAEHVTNKLLEAMKEGLLPLPAHLTFRDRHKTIHSLARLIHARQ